MKWGRVTGGVALAALASFTGLLPASSPAGAADMTPVGRPATSSYIPAQFFWTGFYIGAGIGGSWGTSSYVDPFTGVSASPSLKGFLVSGISGVNFQINSVVLGAEADFTGPFAKGSVLDSSGNSLQTSVFWTSSVAGRLGMAFDRLLVYGRGGVAFDYDRDTVNLPGGTSAIGSLYRVGWTVGGGVEYAVTDHWTGRLEYDYLRFATKGLTYQGTGVPPVPGPLGTSLPGTASGTIGLNVGEIKAIMAYKF
jgi:outer membrane immunogenic protein